MRGGTDAGKTSVRQQGRRHPGDGAAIRTGDKRLKTEDARRGTARREIEEIRLER